MIRIESREYHLPDRTRLDFFQDEHDFRRHLRDHFANPRKCWDRLLGKEFANRFGQNCDQLKVDLLEEAYQKVVKVLDEGIASALEVPVWVAYMEDRQPLDPTAALLPAVWKAAYFFLARQGFIVSARDGRVRTGYFVGDAHVGEPEATLFEKGWQKVKNKFVRDNFQDNKTGELVRIKGVEWHSPANWQKLPVFAPRVLAPLSSLSTAMQAYLAQVQEKTPQDGGDKA